MVAIIVVVVVVVINTTPTPNSKSVTCLDNVTIARPRGLSAGTAALFGGSSTICFFQIHALQQEVQTLQKESVRPPTNETSL